MAARRGPPLVLTPAVGGGFEHPDPAVAPRLDYVELASRINGHVMHPAPANGRLGRLEHGTRKYGDWRQARQAVRSDARAFLSMHEKTAMGVVALSRRRPHVAIAHHVTSERRRALQRMTRWLCRLDRVIAFTREMERYLVEEAGVSPERVRVVYHGVDSRFFAPQGAPEEGYVVSAGQNDRDYPTLMDAMRRVDARTVIAAASPWIGEEERISANPPSNVTIQPRLDRRALRDVYDRASVVVVPLRPGLEIAAGVNALLEASAMGKAVVVSATPGIAEYVADGETGVLVPAGDPAALAEVLADLLADPERRARLGAAARTTTLNGLSFDAFVGGIAATLGEVADLDSVHGDER